MQGSLVSELQKNTMCALQHVASLRSKAAVRVQSAFRFAGGSAGVDDESAVVV
jgi:hypothetical protein